DVMHDQHEARRRSRRARPRQRWRHLVTRLRVLQRNRAAIRPAGRREGHHRDGASATTAPTTLGSSAGPLSLLLRALLLLSLLLGRLRCADVSGRRRKTERVETHARRKRRAAKTRAECECADETERPDLACHL